MHVGAAVTPFRLRAKDARIFAEPGAPSEVEEVVAALAPAPDTWRDLEVEGGSDEIVARRPITMRGNQQGHVYDLWLADPALEIAAEEGRGDVFARRESSAVRARLAAKRRSAK